MKLAIAPIAEPTCTFAEMLPLFSELFEPDISRCMAMVGRIKFLMTNGLAGGHGTSGRGRTRHFPKAHVWELMIGMELTQLGLSPQRAADTFCANEDRFRNGWDWVVEVIPHEGRASGIKVDCWSLNAAAKRFLPELWEG